MFEKITKNKFSGLLQNKDNKIPINCKVLCPPVVNTKIWQNLDKLREHMIHEVLYWVPNPPPLSGQRKKS